MLREERVVFDEQLVVMGQPLVRGQYFLRHGVHHCGLEATGSMGWNTSRRYRGRY